MRSEFQVCDENQDLVKMLGIVQNLEANPVKSSGDFRAMFIPGKSRMKITKESQNLRLVA